MYSGYSSGRHCAVVGCTNNQRKRKLLLQERCDIHQRQRHDCMCGVYSLHAFSVAAEKRRQWIIALNRKDFVPSKFSRVCSVHFIDGRPTNINPCPMLKLGYPRKVTHGRRPVLRVLQATVSNAPGEPANRGVGHEPCTSSSSTFASNAECEPHDATPFEEAGDHGQHVGPLDLRCMKSLLQIESSSDRHEKWSHQSCQVQPTVRDIGTQWEDPYNSIREEHSYAALRVMTTSSETQTVQKTPSEDMSEALCCFYTGLSLDGFWKLVTTVSLAAQTTITMNVGDQVLLTLMRLRLGLLYFDLAIRFGISLAQAGKIFREMLGILSGIMRNVVVWLPLDTILATTPSQFTSSGYGNTSCIIDCTEVPMQRPKRIYSRGQTYSHYKSCNTMKFLVAIAPNGFIMFVSHAYGGRASDKFIVEDSGFTNYLYQDQEVMADRGFALNNSMKEEGVKLNIPAFSRGKSQFSEAEATVSRRISRLRIHVERAINRIKVYRILKGALPITHKKLMNNIVVVCAGLCNLKGPLIAPKHCEDELRTD
ncbi:uncharacterized protein LOC135391360 [Ornithodoros turicata]|uniref:uncharacterized protein LOC135391360 n=1 Tax=Ornithodoros turicata TaxID=34597 RepID=UPI00313A2F83